MISVCAIYESYSLLLIPFAALRTFSAEQLLVLLRDHGDDIAVAAERWLLEALVTWAAAQEGRRHHSTGLATPQQSASSGGSSGVEAPGSPSRWRGAADSPRTSQEGGSSVRGGSLWRDGSGEGASSSGLPSVEASGEQPPPESTGGVGLNRAAHVGAVAAPLLEHVRWDLLPDAPTGAILMQSARRPSIGLEHVRFKKLP